MAAPTPKLRPQVRTHRRVAPPSPRLAPRGPQTRLASPSTALLRTQTPAPLWVHRPSHSVGYNMPLPRRLNMTPWGYTLPGHVRGAFMRTLGGILLRQGRSRSC